MNTATPEGRTKRTEELVEGYKQTKNQAGIVRLIGGSRYSEADYSEADEGMHWTDNVS